MAQWKETGTEVLRTLEKDKFDVALIQEPQVTANGDVEGLTSQIYTLCFARQEGMKRSTILARKPLNTNLNPNCSTNELTVATGDGIDDKTLIILASSFMGHPQQVLLPDAVQMMLRKAENTKQNLVIVTAIHITYYLYGVVRTHMIEVSL